MTPDTVKISRVVSLTMAFQTVHTVYTARTFNITMIHLVNTTGVDVTVQVCLVPLGESESQGNALLWDYTIPAHDFIELGEGYFMLSGGKVQALASAANAINMHLAGIEE